MRPEIEVVMIESDVCENGVLVDQEIISTQYFLIEGEARKELTYKQYTEIISTYI